MKELLLVSWDDLHLKQGEKVPATRTVHFSLNGKPYELDLTDESHEHFMEDLRVYVEAAHKPDIVDGPGTVTAPSGKRRYRHDPDNVRYLRELREFADANGLKYKTATGKYYYALRLHNAFESYRAGAPEAEWRSVYEHGAPRGNKKEQP